MTPPQVLHEQATLREFLDSITYRSYLDIFFADMQAKGKIGQHPKSVQGHEVPWGDFISEQLQRSLRVSQAYHVQAEMTALINTAAHDLESTDYLVHDRLPAEHGFMVLDEPWVATDVWGSTLVTKALAWSHGTAALGQFDDGKSRPGIWVYTFTDINDLRDDGNRDMHEQDKDPRIGRLHLNHFFFLAYEERVGPAEILADEDYLALARVAGTAKGDKIVKIFSPSRRIVALFRLLNQVLVEVREEPLDRRARRGAERRKIPASVQTIKLRRKEYLGPRPEGESHIEWQYQWPVRGHWAWRHCSAEHPYAEPYEKGWHARVYIAPFWKGPENAPVHVSEKVWDLAR